MRRLAWVNLTCEETLTLVLSLGDLAEPTCFAPSRTRHPSLGCPQRNTEDIPETDVGLTIIKQTFAVAKTQSWTLSRPRNPISKEAFLPTFASLPLRRIPLEGKGA
jgi:hypothetical protein